MTIIYQFHGTSGWEPLSGSLWKDPAVFQRYLDSVMSNMDLGWEIPELEWIGEVPRPDVTSLIGAPVFDATARPDLAEWFSSNGKLEKLGGDAEGLTLVRFPEPRDIGYDLSTHPRKGSGRVAFDLPDGAVGFCGEIKVLKLVSVEEPDSGPGFRRWARQNEITGLHFKKIWDSEAEDVLYNPRWGMDALRDPSILD